MICISNLVCVIHNEYLRYTKFIGEIISKSLLCFFFSLHCIILEFFYNTQCVKISKNKTSQISVYCILLCFCVFMSENYTISHIFFVCVCVDVFLLLLNNEPEIGSIKWYDNFNSLWASEFDMHTLCYNVIAHCFMCCLFYIHTFLCNYTATIIWLIW